MPRQSKAKTAILPAQPGDHVREVARQAKVNTALLEKALKKGDFDAAKKALEEGALPEDAVFRDKSGRPTNTAAAVALVQGDANLFHLLLDFGAPLTLTAKGNVWRAALSSGKVEVFRALHDRVKPKHSEWKAALAGPLSSFRALDQIEPLDRNKNLGTYQKTGIPPLFCVKNEEVLQYLLDTGADPNQVPQASKEEGARAWCNTTPVRHLIKCSYEWSIVKKAMEGSIRNMVALLVERGAVLSPEDFGEACSSANEDLIKFFIDQGFRIPPGKPGQSNDPVDNGLQRLAAVDSAVYERAVQYQSTWENQKRLRDTTGRAQGGATTKRL